MSVGLLEQRLRLLHYGLDGVGTGWPAQRRLGVARELDQSLGELGWVTSLLTVHCFPGCDRRARFLGVIID